MSSLNTSSFNQNLVGDLWCNDSLKSQVAGITTTNNMWDIYWNIKWSVWTTIYMYCARMITVYELQPDGNLSLLGNQGCQLVEDAAELMNSWLNILKSFSSALHVTVLQWNHLLFLLFMVLLVLQQWLTLPIHLLSVNLETRNKVSLGINSKL